MATSKNYGKKGSDHFRDILNPYGEKSNYGKIGRRRRLSKLNVLFFSIILSVTIILLHVHCTMPWHHDIYHIYHILTSWGRNWNIMRPQPLAHPCHFQPTGWNDGRAARYRFDSKNQETGQFAVKNHQFLSISRSVMPYFPAMLDGTKG